MLPPFTGAESPTLADWIAMSRVPEVQSVHKYIGSAGAHLEY